MTVKTKKKPQPKQTRLKKVEAILKKYGITVGKSPKFTDPKCHAVFWDGNWRTTYGDSHEEAVQKAIFGVFIPILLRGAVIQHWLKREFIKDMKALFSEGKNHMEHFYFREEPDNPPIDSFEALMSRLYEAGFRILCLGGVPEYVGKRLQRALSEEWLLDLIEPFYEPTTGKQLVATYLKYKDQRSFE